MKVIYIDSLFALNFAVNFLLLLATAKLCALTIAKLRFTLAALLGALYACAVVIPGVPGFAGAMPLRLTAGVLLALIAFGSQRSFLRHLLIFFGLAAGFAGVSLLIGRVSFKTLLITIVGAYAVITTVFRFAAAHKPIAASATSKLQITVCGRSATVTVLNDSGNALRDPLSGSVLPVINYGAIAPMLPDAARDALDSGGSVSGKYEKLLHCGAGLSPRLVPYRAIGTDSGLLITLKADGISIDGVQQSSARFAVSPTPINFFGGII